MTPLPKKKHAKSRSRTRHSTKGISLPSLIACANCGNLRFPHRVCPNCGQYKKADKTKAKEETESKPPKKI